jgi:membrane fusion protein (multidrug efflux system)
MRYRAWLAALGFCIVTFSLLGYIKFTQVSAAIAFGESFPEPSETVVAHNATLSQWQAQLQVLGEVKATRSLVIRNELAGVITHIGFSSGGKVGKGDSLLTLDSLNEQAQLDAVEAEITLAKLDLSRLAQLVQTRASSRSQVDEANAQLAVKQANARSLRATIGKKTLLAPFDGITGLHAFEVGAFIAANSLIINLIGDENKVWVDFSIPQSEYQISPDVELTTSRNLRSRAELDNQKAHLKPGTSVQVRVPIGEMKTIVRLPNTAIRYDSFGAYVYLLNQGEGGKLRAARKPVTVGAHDQKEVVVLSGLDVNDVVATVGSFKLRPGMLVNLTADSAPGSQ